MENWKLAFFMSVVVFILNIVGLYYLYHLDYSHLFMLGLSGVIFFVNYIYLSNAQVRVWRLDALTKDLLKVRNLLMKNHLKELTGESNIAFVSDREIVEEEIKNIINNYSSKDLKNIVQEIGSNKYYYSEKDIQCVAKFWYCLDMYG